MPNFEIISSIKEIPSTKDWLDSEKFDSKNRIVDESGKPVRSYYEGRQFKLVSKKERAYSFLERCGRGFLGSLAAVCSLGLALLCMPIRELFTKQKEKRRFGILMPIPDSSIRRGEPLPIVPETPNKPKESPTRIIEKFWEKHIQSFSINHGTSSLYLKHFKQYGISATYPEALHNQIAKIRKVWSNHEHDIAPKTEYFRMFENRYDLSRREKKVAVSFSGDSLRHQEYTFGARGYGGEWMREIRHFLQMANEKKDLLNSEEQSIIAQTEALSEVLKQVPPMIVKVRGGSPSISTILPKTALIPIDDLIERIKKECPEWQNPKNLNHYLDKMVLPELNKEKNKHQKQYEIVVRNNIKPEDLDFEICKIDQNRLLPVSNKYPKLKFDIPTKLTNDEVFQLLIERSGFSEIEEYRDSRFTYEYQHESNTYVVIRRKCSQEDLEMLALRNEQQKLQKQWRQIFDCEELMG